MRSDVFRDAGTLGYQANLFVNSRMVQWVVLLGEKNKDIRFRRERIVIFPPVDVFRGHDEADISWFAGFEIDVDDNAVLIEFEIIPDQSPNLSDTKATFIEHGDDGPVPAVLAGPYHRSDFFFGEEVTGFFCHGLLGRDSDLTEFFLVDVGVFAFDHPDIKLLKNYRVVGQGILFVWLAVFGVGRFDTVNTLIDVDDGVLTKRTDEFSPSYQVKNDFVDAGRRDVSAGFVFTNKFVEKADIILGDLAV